MRKKASILNYIFIIKILSSNTICMDSSLPKAAMSPQVLKMVGDLGLRAYAQQKTSGHIESFGIMVREKMLSPLSR